jgi:enoyl-CoA hydratase/carnithine racemase
MIAQTNPIEQRAMSSPGFTITSAGALATITLNRPERHNVLSVADLPALDAAIREATARAGIRVLILTGSGGKSFSSGIDLGQVAGHDWRDNPLEPLCDGLENIAIPTICALNGSVFGGAVDLTLACDFRLGVHGMRLVMPPARIGVQYHAGGLRRAVARMGLGAAKRLFLASEALGDAALLRSGYLDELLRPEDLAGRTAELAATLAGHAPLAVAGMKRTLNEIARGDFDEGRARERAQASFDTADFKEGLQALLAKRPPVFHGR